MQFKSIALAVAAALVAPAAFAATLSATNVIYVGGASAQTPGLAKAIGTFCSATVDTYTDNQDGKQSYAYFCSSANAASGLSGSFLVVKLDAGGSANGVAPVVNQVAKKFLNVNNCTVGTGINGNANFYVGNLKGSCDFTATGALVVPQIGLSDVADNVWTARGQFTPAANYVVNAGTGANFAGQGFGVIASNELYTALQADQIAAGTLPATCTAGDYTPGTCQPSISKEQYANFVTNTNPGSPYQASWAALLPHTNTNANWVAAQTAKQWLCRRAADSGTQASSDIYFLNTPCNKLTALGGDLAPLAGDSANYPAGSTSSNRTGTSTKYAADGSIVSANEVLEVIENSSTGNAKTCVGTTGRYALGVISLENANASTDKWKYVKLNGVSPNPDGFAGTYRQTVVSGEYDFAFETEMLYRADANAAVQAFGLALVTELGNGTQLGSFKGIYADPTSGAPYVAGATHKGTRANNVCAPHTLYF